MFNIIKILKASKDPNITSEIAKQKKDLEVERDRLRSRRYFLVYLIEKLGGNIINRYYSVTNVPKNCKNKGAIAILNKEIDTINEQIDALTKELDS
jgi:chaperonin cofactor prefoldin